MKKSPIAETERLVLRRVTLEDAPFVLDLVNQPAFLRFIGDKDVADLDDAEAYIESGPILSYETHGFGPYAVCRASDGVRVGLCGLYQRDFLDRPDLGFAFLESFCRRGYAAEASHAVLRIARDSYTIPRIAAIVDADNERSLRLLTRLGFEFEGVITVPDEEREVQLLGRTLGPD